MMRDFGYYAPRTLKEACGLLRAHPGEAKVLAGGTMLLFLMKQRLAAPAYLVDLAGVPGLVGLRRLKDRAVAIGAMTPHRAVEHSPLLTDGLGVLARMAQRIGSPQVRGTGTIGGSLCHADPAGDPAPVLQVLEAQARLASIRGERAVPVDAFFTDYYTTSVAPDEILTAIHVPAPPPGFRATYLKYAPRSVMDFALVGVAVAGVPDRAARTLARPRVALAGVGPIPMRATEAERRLAGGPLSDAAIDEGARVAADEARPVSDLRGSAEYRRAMVAVLVARAVREVMA